MNYPNYPMNNYGNPHHKGEYADIQAMPMQVSCVDPYVVSALMPLIGKKLVVETVRGSLYGKLMDVKPDHIVVGEMYGDSRFFIRIAEIVHIMPDVNDSKCPQYKY